MADEEQKKEAPAEEAPPWFTDYRDQMNSQLGQAFDSLARQQQAVAQQVSQAPQQGDAPAPPKLPENADEKILHEFFNNPTRFVAEMGQINRNQAAQIASDAVNQYRQESEQSQQAGQFWSEFYQHNHDLQNYAPMIQHLFQSQPGNVDPSERANSAAAQVRQLVAQERANALEDQKRQAKEKSLAASPMPGAFPGAPVQGGDGEDVDPRKATEGAVADMNKARFKRMAANW